MNLAQIKSGDSCKIRQLHAKGRLLQKLLDMGFVYGAKIEVIREAPLYDPMELKIQDYTIVIRKSEALLIEVEL